jgi:hypothetical protein
MDLRKTLANYGDKALQPSVYPKIPANARQKKDMCAPLFRRSPDSAEIYAPARFFQAASFKKIIDLRHGLQLL